MPWKRKKNVLENGLKPWNIYIGCIYIQNQTIKLILIEKLKKKLVFLAIMMINW